jgi:soluble cytochrome b562
LGKTSPRRQFTSDIANKDEVQKWLREKDVSIYRQGLETLITHYDKCLKKFSGFVEK